MPLQRGRVSFHGCSRLENIHSALTLPITHIDWSSDSEHIMIAGQDARMKIYPRMVVNHLQQKGFTKAANNLIGHRGAVIGAFFMGCCDGSRELLERLLAERNTGAQGETDEPTGFQECTEASANSTTGVVSSTESFFSEKDKKHQQDLLDLQNEVDADGTKFIVSISSDNAVLLWERTTTTRNELLQYIAEMKLKARVNRGTKKSKKLSNEDDQDDDEEKEDSDKEFQEDPYDDDCAMPETFLEKQKREIAAEEGVKVSNASDIHLPPCLRYAYEVRTRHLLQHKGTVTVADYHRKRSLLVVGYSSGIFAIHTAAASDCTLVHLLSISAQALTACRFSPSGDHLAFGSAHLKQLLVWDWKGESYLLKEQSHYYDITNTAMTADGECIISGGDDGKIKVWKTSSGQCIVTFTEHTAGITGIAASNATNAFFTASKDGTVRGFDLVRYRNFRIFHTPERSQCSCVAIDPSGEVLAVGSAQHTKITLFSVKTGRVIDELQGHEGPVTCLAFHPNGTTLASGALDKTLIIWDIFGGSTGNEAEGGDRLKGEGEVVQLNSEVLSVAYSHNGKRMATLTLSGEVTVLDAIIPNDPQIIINFKTTFDAAGGWSNKGLGPNSANSNARFTTLSFSPDGEKLVAGGESKWIVLYHATQGFVIKKWPVTTNLDVDGNEEQYKWRVQSEAGNVNDIDVGDDDVHLRNRKLIEMPGSKHRHFATGKRKTELVARTMHVAFSSHGRDFVAATTDGLLVFSLDVHRSRFIPLQLQQDLTVMRVRELIKDGHYVQAMIGALLLQDENLGIEAMRRSPKQTIAVTVGAIPTVAFPTFIAWVAKEVESSLFLEKSLLWAQALVMFSNEPMLGVSGGALLNHRESKVITSAAASIIPALKLLHRALQRTPACEGNGS